MDNTGMEFDNFRSRAKKRAHKVKISKDGKAKPIQVVKYAAKQPKVSTVIDDTGREKIASVEEPISQTEVRLSQVPEPLVRTTIDETGRETIVDEIPQDVAAGEGEDSFSSKKTLKKGAKFTKGGIKAGLAGVNAANQLRQGNIKGSLKSARSGVNGLKTQTSALKKSKKSKSKDVMKQYKSVGDAAIAFTDPLVNAMKIGLKTKGYNTSAMTKPAIIEKFHNEFVSKKNDPSSSYDEIPSGTFENHYLFKADYDSFDADSVVGQSDIQGVVNVGKGIVSKFKSWRNKKKAAKASGQNPKQVMDKTDLLMATEGDKVVKKLENEQSQNAPQTVGETQKIVKYAIYTVIAIALIYLMVKLSKK